METGGPEAYRVLIKGGEGEIVEKKSRFIATVRTAACEEEALAFIEEMRKKYWDARHNCFAYVLGAKGETVRFGDDGEPGGTAGRPMLEVLLGEGIRNIAVVVTRYFGGILLGTGGLVRAYTQAVKAGLENAQTAWMRYGCELKVETDYNGVGRILYLLGQRGIEVEHAEYGETVSLEITAPREAEGALRREIAEATNGRAAVNFVRETYYIDKKTS